MSSMEQVCPGHSRGRSCHICVADGTHQAAMETKAAAKAAAKATKAAAKAAKAGKKPTAGGGGAGKGGGDGVGAAVVAAPTAAAVQLREMFDVYYTCSPFGPNLPRVDSSRGEFLVAAQPISDESLAAGILPGDIVSMVNGHDVATLT